MLRSFLALAAALLVPAAASAQDLLVVTTAVSGPHASLAEATSTVEAIGAERGWNVTVTADPAAVASLDEFEAVMFLLTEGSFLDETAQTELEVFVRGGGGFVGVHSALVTETEWDFYAELVDVRATAIADPTEAEVLALDRAHGATAPLPLRWTHTDELYALERDPRGTSHVVAVLRERADGAGEPNGESIAWCRPVDAGRAFTTGLGARGWDSPELRAHVEGALAWALGVEEGDCGATIDAAYARRVITPASQPMGLDIADDGRVFFVERTGTVRVYDPSADVTRDIGALDVFTEIEMGLLGIALDPDFASNGWLYLMYSPLAESVHRIARFTVGGNPLGLSDERVLLSIPTQREQCCHSAGGMDFDEAGNLFVSIGNNTNPFDRGGYGEDDERDGNAFWDAQRTSGNTQDLRGKILRIHPEPDGTYTVPDGNLFPGGSGGLPEIYAMGVKNTLRIAYDPESRILWAADVGPDAQSDSPTRGPRGYDEINRLTGPANLGWPYCLADNQAYGEHDYESGETGDFFDCANLVNESPNNSGARELPPAQGAFIWYPYAPSPEFPVYAVEGRGRAAMAGPVYHHVDGGTLGPAFPRYLDDSLLVYDFARHTVYDVRFDASGDVLYMHRLFESLATRGPIDMRFDPDGRLYLLEFGAERSPGVGQLVRFDYVGAPVTPTAIITADRTSGSAPFTVNVSGTQSSDPNGDTLAYAWDFGRDGIDSTEVEASHTYDNPGSAIIRLTVTDPDGNEGVASLRVVIGNETPTIRFVDPPDEGLYVDGEFLYYRVEVDDAEDGTTDSCDVCEAVEVEISLGHDTHAHPLTTRRGCEGLIALDDEHDEGANLYYVLTARYTDRGGEGADAITASATVAVRPQRIEAEFAPLREGLTADPDGESGFRVRDGSDGDYLGWDRLNLTNILRAEVRVSREVGGTLEAHRDAPDGPMIGSVEIGSGSGFDSWETVDLPLDSSTETAPLYLVWRGDAGEPRLFDIDWIEFVGAGVSETRPGPVPRFGSCATDPETPGGGAPRGGGCGCRAAPSRAPVPGLALILLALFWRKFRGARLDP